MNLLKAYYYKSAQILLLNKCLPYVPEVQLTDAKTYFGRIYEKNGVFTRIALSKWNLIDDINWLDEEDKEEIIDTICHEFAHMFFWEHGEDHTTITEAFKTLVKSRLEVERLQEELRLIS